MKGRKLFTAAVCVTMVVLAGCGNVGNNNAGNNAGNKTGGFAGNAVNNGTTRNGAGMNNTGNRVRASGHGTGIHNYAGSTGMR